MKKFAQILLLALLISGCIPASSNVPTSEAKTQTATLSKTPHASNTALPSVTPYPPLQTEGPYLMFLGNDNNLLILLDKNGGGREIIQIPDDSYVQDLEKAASPNGKWLVYFTGSTDSPYDLALNIFNLKDKTSYQVSKLIAPGFPENLEPLKDLIYFDEFNKEEINNNTLISNTLFISFIEGSLRFDWSPDSNELAFSAQIDQASTDMYVYNVSEKSVRRLTNEPENIGLSIEWAPNGNKILYETAIPSVNYSSYYLHVIDPNQKSPQNPKSIYYGMFWSRKGWIGDNLYLIAAGGEGAPAHNFRSINTDTQQIKQVWKFVAEASFIDANNGKIFLLTYPEGFIDPLLEPKEGLFLVNFDGKYTRITNESYIPLIAGPNNTYFVLQINNNSKETYPLLSIDIEGNLFDLGEEISYSFPPQTSPDNKWVIVTNSQGTFLYSDKLEIIHSWDIENTLVIWRPDSNGFFLLSYSEMYYVSMSNKQFSLIDICPSKDCNIGHEYVWIP